jgi:ferritin
MLDKQIEEALNDQINMELTAWYRYLAMSAYFDGLNFSGFATFMDNQAREEQEHAHRLFRYLLDRDGTPDFKPIPAPAQSYDSMQDAFAAAVDSEKANTQAIHKLYELAREKSDYATIAHLQWFLDEQVEEEKIMTEAHGLVEFAGDDKSALLALNQQYGSAPPNAEGAEGNAGGNG